MDAPSLLEIFVGMKAAVRAAEAFIEQAAALEETDLRIIQQAKTKIAESRALLAEVELLHPNLGPSRSSFPIIPPQDAPALR